jgi:hypothetical protein
MKGWTSDLFRVWVRITGVIAAGLLVALILVDQQHWPVLIGLAVFAELWNTSNAIKSWLFAARYAWFWWKR